MADQKFYETLREQAARTGMTIREIATAAGLPANTVGMFLNGNIQKVQVEMLWRLSKVLGVPFEALCRQAVGAPAASEWSLQAQTVASQFDQLPRELREALLVMVTQTRLHRPEQLHDSRL
jgi:transcriptional regulator with XRE-family HTH domain